MPGAEIICSGIVERIGLDNPLIIHKTYIKNKEIVKKEIRIINDHSEGLLAVAGLLTDKETGVIKDATEIDVVGHRVVHGGESFAATTIITEEVKEQIKRLFPLAPLHNLPNYMGIDIAENIFTTAKQVAVFDTAFHQTIPEMAYRYAIPASFYHEHAIRAYGFHGTSHKYVAAEAIKFLNKPNTKIVTIHLGNGCSIAAVDNGRCVDTSMGLGPMNGLIMGTRCGDIDQSVIFHLVKHLGYGIDEVNDVLNKKSGMLGLTGLSDMRDIKVEIEKENITAKLAYDMYAYRIKKYIGAYAAVLNGLDAIVFTAGVGENDSLIRQLCTSALDYLGVKTDIEKNKLPAKELHEINTPDSRVKVLVVPTNEELEIANQCYELLKNI